MVITKSFYLDINTPWKAPTLYIKQGDVDSRKLQATIRKDGTNYSIPGDVFATFRMHKPDDTFVTQDCTISGSVVSVVMDAQCATAAGHGKAEFVLQTASEVVSTFLLAIEILPSAVSDGDIESRDALGEYRTILEEMLRVKGAPLVANTAADMTDTDRVYVYTGSEVGYVNGDWYYYDGAAWTLGGVYNSQAIGLAYQQEVAQMVKQSAVASESDSTPYLYRPTPNPSAILADEEIVGGTIAFNQLADNTLPPTNRDSLTFSGSESGFTVNGTASAAGNAAGWFGIGAGFWASRQNHKVLYSMVLLSGSITGNVYFVPWDSSAPTPVNMNQQKIATVPNTTGRALFRYDSGTVFTNAKIGINIMDLTADFGSTIADYLYTLESGTAGAGVAKLREWGFLSKIYYPYNAGSLISVNTEGKEVVGFNLWDEVWEVGGIDDTTGQNVTSSTTIRSMNYTRVLQNATYYMHVGGGVAVRMYFYDGEKNYLSYINTGSATFTVPSDAEYIRFRTYQAYGTTYKHDICINISNAQLNGLYRPYRVTTYPTTPTDLNGIFKLDANNQLYADGDRYKADGTITRRITSHTFTGSESFTKIATSTTGWSYYAWTASPAKPSEVGADANIVSDYAASVPYNSIYQSTTIASKMVTEYGGGIRFISDAVDVTAFKAEITGKTVFYLLSTSTTDTADPYPATQIVGKGGTERWIDNRSVPVPVGHRTTYSIGVPDVPASGSNLVLKATASGGKTTLKWE